MVKHIFFTFIVLFVSLYVDAKRRKKREHKKSSDVDPKQLKPSKTTPELWCDTCNAIVHETHKLLRGKRTEADVYDITDDVCNPLRYYTYSNRYYNFRSSSFRQEGQL